MFRAEENPHRRSCCSGRAGEGHYDDACRAAGSLQCTRPQDLGNPLYNLYTLPLQVGCISIDAVQTVETGALIQTYTAAVSSVCIRDRGRVNPGQMVFMGSSIQMDARFRRRSGKSRGFLFPSKLGPKGTCSVLVEHSSRSERRKARRSCPPPVPI